MNKGIDTLIASISKQIDGLKNGTLTVSELNELTEQSRELYEILVVLRFSKASSQNTSASAEKQTESAPIVEEKEVPVETISAPAEEILFDFSGPESTTEVSEEIDLFASVAPPVIEEPKKEIIEQVEKTNEETLEDGQIDSSINKNYHDQFSNSIASKMELQPISSLSGHISLNQKFTFISNLFGNNADAYNQQISELDRLGNDLAAKERLVELKEQYQWDLDNKMVEEFVTIVERRYL